MTSLVAKAAVLVSVALDGNDVRISIDDVSQSQEGGDIWLQGNHVSSKTMPLEKFRALEVDEKELADLAYFILVRMAATASLLKS